MPSAVTVASARTELTTDGSLNRLAAFENADSKAEATTGRLSRPLSNEQTLLSVSREALQNISHSISDRELPRTEPRDVDNRARRGTHVDIVV